MQNARNRVWNAIKGQRVGPLLGWNVPLGLVGFGYLLGSTKLELLQYTGMKIVNWNNKTERAIELILWIHEHLWAFLVLAVTANLFYVFRPEGRELKALRFVVLISLTVVALWYFELALYLSGKIIGL